MRKKLKIACYHGPTNTFFVMTPVGEIHIISCPRGLHSIEHSISSEDTFFTNLRQPVHLTSQLYCDNGYSYSPAVHCIEWLKNYFNREQDDSHPTLCPSISSGTFSGKAWHTLMEIAPFGTTVSYKDLSSAMGKPSAAQAVGQAMASNPFMLVVPCHRVIRNNGAVGNYSRGSHNFLKHWLLDFEKCIM